MQLDQFMLWRFRNIEGVLDFITSWNVNECNFSNGSKITYDLKNDSVTIENHSGIDFTTITMPLTECTKDKLLSLGFIEREFNRHSLSYNK